MCMKIVSSINLLLMTAKLFNFLVIVDSAAEATDVKVYNIFQMMTECLRVHSFIT